MRVINMQEYSRIIIEEYCMTHNSAKSRRLQKLHEKSYDVSSAPGTDADAVFLEKTIDQMTDPDMKEALKELDEFVFGY